jgi:hypothetical protein
MLKIAQENILKTITSVHQSLRAPFLCFSNYEVKSMSSLFDICCGGAEEPVKANGFFYNVSTGIKCRRHQQLSHIRGPLTQDKYVDNVVMFDS